MLLDITQQTGYFLKPDLVESSLLRLTEVYCCVMCDFLRRCELVCWLLKHVALERGLLLGYAKIWLPIYAEKLQVIFRWACVVVVN